MKDANDKDFKGVVIFNRANGSNPTSYVYSEESTSGLNKCK